MKKHLFFSLFFVAALAAMCSCSSANMGEDIFVRPESQSKLVGTWELQGRVMCSPEEKDGVYIYPGTKKYPTELTFFHDGEYQNLYDGDRTDKGSWKVFTRNRIRMKSFDNVPWGVVRVYNMQNSGGNTYLVLQYIIKGSMPEDVLVSSEVNYARFAKNNNDVVVYIDRYKKIKDGED